MAAKTIKSDKDKLEILLEWKKAYANAIIKALNPTGDVLQIGFITGATADAIQKHHPKAHTILISNSESYNDAKKWAEKHPKIKIIHGDLKKELHNLGTFDAIFFNDYPLEHEVRIMNFLFPEEDHETSEKLHEASEKFKDLLHKLEKELPNLKMQFSDKDVEDFYHKIGQHNQQELPKFFKKLTENGNITKTQYDHAAKKYHFSEIEENIKKNHEKKSKSEDKMLMFLKEALNKHLNKGGHFSAILNDQNSKYEDEHFHDAIINNPGVNYKEISVPIKLSHKTIDALVIIVEKI